MSDEIGINATDLARLIGERNDFERAVQRAQDADREWRAALDDAETKYDSFHRAVQEAIGWDQPRLVPEGKLLGQIRYLVTLRALDDLPPSAEEPPVAQVPLRMVRADDAMAGKGFETPPDSVPWAVDDLVEHRSGTDGGIYRARVTARVVDPGYEGTWWDVVVTEILRDPADTAGVIVGQCLRMREDGPGGMNRRLGGLDTGPDTAVMPAIPGESIPAEGDEVTPVNVADMLALVGVDSHLGVIATWTPEQQREAFTWAAATHLSASDNTDVEIPPRPEFLP